MKYKITKATVIKDGRPVKEFRCDRTVETDGLEEFKKEVKAQYMEREAAHIDVDLQYKETDGEAR